MTAPVAAQAGLSARLGKGIGAKVGSGLAALRRNAATFAPLDKSAAHNEVQAAGLNPIVTHTLTDFHSNVSGAGGSIAELKLQPPRLEYPSFSAAFLSTPAEHGDLRAQLAKHENGAVEAIVKSAGSDEVKSLEELIKLASAEAAAGKGFSAFGAEGLEDLSELKMSRRREKLRSHWDTQRLIARHFLGTGWTDRFLTVATIGSVFLSKKCGAYAPTKLRLLTQKLTSAGDRNSACKESGAGTTKLGEWDSLDVREVFSLIVQYNGLQLLARLFEEIRSYLFARVTVNAAHSLTAELYDRLERQTSLNAIVARPSGEVVHMIQSTSTALSDFMGNMFLRVLGLVFECGVIAGRLRKAQHHAASRIISATLGSYVAATFLYSNRRVKHRQDALDSQTKLRGILTDNVMNLESVRLLDARKVERLAQSRYQRAATNVTKHNLKLRTSLSKLNAMQETIFTFGATRAMLSVFNRLISNDPRPPLSARTLQSVSEGDKAGEENSVGGSTETQLQTSGRNQASPGAIIGDIMEVKELCQRVANPFKFLGTCYREMVVNYGTIRKTLEFLRNHELQSQQNSTPKPPLSINRGSIIVSNLSFRYGDSGPLALSDINMRILGGSKIGIVGRSGSGKSTLLKLILRLYEPETGVLKICGQDLTECDLASIREQVALVGQETILFNDTLRRNLLFGNPRAKNISDDEILTALENAQLTTMLKRLSHTHTNPQTVPHTHEGSLKPSEGSTTSMDRMELAGALERKVGERGNLLSGGEKQRVAIARCMLRQPRIILLDEPMAHLDAETQESVSKALTNLTQGKTTLTVAHQLRTIVDCDQIFVMDQGRIVNAGNHLELLNLKGDTPENTLYRSLWTSQHAGVNDSSSVSSKAKAHAHETTSPSSCSSLTCSH